MVLLALAALLGALILFEVAGLRMTKANAEITVDRAMNPTGQEPNAMEAYLAQAKSMAEALKKANLFVPKPPKEHPVKEVLGILGHEALINGKWYKAGDSIGEAKIEAVEPTKVTIVWNDEKKEFSPIGSGGSGGPGGPRAPRRPGRDRPSRPGGAPMVVTGSRAGPRRGPPGFSPEETAKLRERYMNMSPQERERFRQEMRERYGGRSR